MLLMRMFVFLLQCACRCNATVVLETVVDAQDYSDRCGGKLQDDTVVVGYRLWIPLEAGNEESFLAAVTAELVPVVTVIGTHTAPGSAWAGKRRRVEEHTADIGADTTLPPYAQRLTGAEELSKIMKLYFLGQRTDFNIVVGSEMVGSSTTHVTLGKLLSAADQFHNPQFIARCQDGVWEAQTEYANYVDDGAFYPTEAIRPLCRLLTCGATGAFLKTGADIFKYVD